VINNHKSLLEEFRKASFAFQLACRHGEYRSTRATPAPFFFSHANKEIFSLPLSGKRKISLSLVYHLRRGISKINTE
jgi:hypothetical protein